MIFYLDQSVFTAIQDNACNRDDNVVALQNIATARRLGTHLVFGEVQTMISLSQSNLFSPIVSSIFRRLSNLVVTQSQILNLVDEVIVVYDEATGQQDTLAFSAKRNFLDLRKFLHHEMLSSVMLLGENQLDAEFYGFLGKRYIEISKLKSLYVQFTPLGGGGDSTWQPYSQVQSDGKRLCLCIVDSDIAAPGLSIGPTAQKVKRVHKESCQSVTWTHIQARHLESLIPVEWYVHLSECDHTLRDTIMLFVHAFNNDDINFKQYANLKNGLKGKEILSASEFSLLRKYWKEFTEKRSKLDQQLSTCYSAGECSNKKGCDCWIVPPLGKIAFKVLELYAQKTVEDSCVRLREEWLETEWNRLGRLVWSWCCSDSGLTAV